MPRKHRALAGGRKLELVFLFSFETNLLGQRSLEGGFVLCLCITCHSGIAAPGRISKALLQCK